MTLTRDSSAPDFAMTLMSSVYRKAMFQLASGRRIRLVGDVERQRVVADEGVRRQEDRRHDAAERDEVHELSVAVVDDKVIADAAGDRGRADDQDLDKRRAEAERPPRRARGAQPRQAPSFLKLRQLRHAAMRTAMSVPA